MLRQSESELEKVLQCSRHLIDKQNACGLRPLHLSANWPCGIEILLSYEADVNVADDWGWAPVEHAIWLLCPESVALLDQAGCAMHPNSREYGGTLGSAIQLAEICTGEEALRATRIAESAIAMEADRRRTLRALLSHCLPESSIGTRMLSEDSLLDVYANDAVLALEQQGVSIPKSLEFASDTYSGTVYHTDYLTPALLTSLWETGFRDINEPAPNGCPPLTQPVCPWCSSLDTFLKRVDWFLDKGIDPNQTNQQIHQNSYWNCNSTAVCPCRKSGHTAMHFLAVNLALFKTWACLTGNIVPYSKDTRARAVIKDIFNSETQDVCKCACSSAGCRAINTIVKFTIKYTLPEPCDWEDMFRSVICPIPAAKANDIISETIFSEIVRALTFHALDLTHTCCRETENWYKGPQLIPFEDEDDISEIHDEERENLELLEDLLLEFERQRHESPSSYQNFIEGYWSTRMREVLCGNESPDEALEDGPLDEGSEEESLDEGEFRETGADSDDISAYQSSSD